MIAAADLRGAAVLSATFIVFVAVAEAWRRWGSPTPEATRKLVHLGGGLACLLFPFLVSSTWVVLILALAMSGLFAAAARLGFLPSLHGVSRSSRGVEYYPLAVFLVFLMTRDRTWLYVAAVLVLAVGDAFAALVGGRYGVIRYQVEEDHKSLEGSLVFLVITFLAAHLPMLLMTDLPRDVCVLAAVLVAILATGFEAISLHGADNLFVPFAVVFILGKITTKPLAEIVFQNLSLAGLCLLIAVLVWRFPLFNVGATIAVILHAYGTWSLGSWQWALPVLCGVGYHLAISVRGSAPRPERRVRVRMVARALILPFGLLILANSSTSYGFWYGPYLAASAVVLAFAVSHPAPAGGVPGGRRVAGTLLMALVASVVVLGPALLAGDHVPVALAILVVASVIGAAGLHALLRGPAAGAAREGWTAAQFLLTAAASAVIAVAQRTGIVQGWPL